MKHDIFLVDLQRNWIVNTASAVHLMVAKKGLHAVWSYEMQG